MIYHCQEKILLISRVTRLIGEIFIFENLKPIHVSKKSIEIIFLIGEKYFL